MLRSICLPDEEPISGSKCVTSGINKDSKSIDSVPLNLFNHTFCDNHSVYKDYYETTLNENQLCAGLPSTTNTTVAFNGQYQEDLGGPLICLDNTAKPIFTGVTSYNSLSTKTGYPEMIHI